MNKIRFGNEKTFRIILICIIFIFCIIFLLCDTIYSKTIIILVFIIYIIIMLFIYYLGNHKLLSEGIKIREFTNQQYVLYKDISLIIISISSLRSNYRYIKSEYRYIGYRNKYNSHNITYKDKIPYPWISLSKIYTKRFNINNKEYSRSYIDRYLFDVGNYIYSFICKDKKNIDVLLKNYPGKYCITLSFLRYQLDKVIDVIEEYNIDKSRIEIIEDENMYPEYTRFTVEDVKEFF